jgi:hypothetical protein
VLSVFLACDDPYQVAQPLSQRPWGELAFDAVIAGYRFLISQEPVSGDI